MVDQDECVAQQYEYAQYQKEGEILETDLSPGLSLEEHIPYPGRKMASDVHSPLNLQIENSRWGQGQSMTAFNAAAISSRISQDASHQFQTFLTRDDQQHQVVSRTSQSPRKSLRKKKSIKSQQNLYSADQIDFLARQWNPTYFQQPQQNKISNLSRKQAQSKISSFMERQNQYQLNKEQKLEKMAGDKMSATLQVKNKKSFINSTAASGSERNTNNSHQVRKKKSKRLTSFETVDRNQHMQQAYYDEHQNLIVPQSQQHPLMINTANHTASGSVNPLTPGYQTPGANLYQFNQFATSQSNMVSGIHTPGHQPYLSQTVMPTGLRQQQQEYFKFEPNMAPPSGGQFMLMTAQGPIPVQTSTKPTPNSIQTANCQVGCLPRPRSSANGGKILSTAKKMPPAVFHEEILDEFPDQSIMPVANDHPKTSEYSMEQRSFLRMQMELNNSSRYEADPHKHDTSTLHRPIGAGLAPADSASKAFMGLGTQERQDTHKQLAGPLTHPRRQTHSFASGNAYQEKSPPNSGGVPYSVNHHQSHSQTARIHVPGPQGSQQHLGSAIKMDQIGGDAIQNISHQNIMNINMLDSEFGEDSRQIVSKPYRVASKTKSSQKVYDRERGSKMQMGSSHGSRKILSANKARGDSHHGLHAKKKIVQSNLDSGSHNGVFAQDEALTARSQLSRSSRRSISKKQLNMQLEVKAREEIQRQAELKRQSELEAIKEAQKAKKKQEHAKQLRDQLYLSNKLTRQFIMVTSLVMQSEDLSEDSVFNYSQYTEFAIRFGLMNERAAGEESDERALLYEMWCTISRVHPDCAFIKVVNLKTIITAILGFPIAIHENPHAPPIRRPKRRPKVNQRENPAIKVKTMETSDDEEFNLADNLGDEVALENNYVPQNYGMTATGGVTQNSESTPTKSRDQQNPSSIPRQFLSGGINDPSTIDERDEYDQLSSPEYDDPRNGGGRRQNLINMYQQEVQNEENEYGQEQDYYQRQSVQPDPDAQSLDDQPQCDESSLIQNQQQNQPHLGEVNEEEEYGGEGEEANDEFALDRAHKIGFFWDNFEFCMSGKDVKTVQRRFKLFTKNWKEFQKKDLIVKKSVIVDDGVTFQPAINKKSIEMVKMQQYGNVEFPLSNQGPQTINTVKRKRIWEKELPKGQKFKDRIQHSLEQIKNQQHNVGSRDCLFQQENGQPVKHMTTALDNSDLGHKHTNYQLEYGGNEYFTVGSDGAASNANMLGSFKSRGAMTAKSSGKKGLTMPQMSDRMERQYQVGRNKLLSRQDIDKDQLDYIKGFDQCTFTPIISHTSRTIADSRQVEKPWQEKDTSSQRSARLSCQDRMQLAIYKDIERKQKGHKERVIKEKILQKGGWIKDYPEEGDGQQPFKNYNKLSTISNSSASKPKNSSRSARKKMQNQSAAAYAGNQRSSLGGPGDQQNSHQNARYPLTSNTSQSNLHQTNQQQFEEYDQIGQHQNFETHSPELGGVSPDKLSTGGGDQQEYNLTSQFNQNQLTGPKEQTKLFVDSEGRIVKILPTQTEAGKRNSLHNKPPRYTTSLSNQKPSDTHQFSDEKQGNPLKRSHDGPPQAFEQSEHDRRLSYPKSSVAGDSQVSHTVPSSTRVRKPLIFIDVDTEQGQSKERIEVYKGDNPRLLATDFCNRHGYDQGTMLILERQIEERLQRAYAKLEAKKNARRQARQSLQ